MRIRVVVASEAEAAFYDLSSRLRAPTLISRLSDPLAHLHDRDFKSDRPGRFFHHAPAAGQRRGAVARHGTGGERRPRKQEAVLFARKIVEQLEQARAQHEFDRLVVMAGPGFLGLLRKAIPEALRAQVAAEVRKDLVHEPPRALGTHIPPEVFHALPAAAS
jgi:protein required for attachment to host cells